jgi:hypothetical protein
MTWSRRTLLAAGIAAGIALGADAHAEWIVVPPRPGQVGLGVQAQYGTLLKSGSFGEEYSSGPGVAVRVRYRLRYERAIGMSFESQGFDARVDPAGDYDPLKSSFFTAGVEFYQMFNTRTRTTKMLSLGAGLAKISVKLNDGETAFPSGGDGVFVSAGAGVEHFFWQGLAYDVSTRYMTVIQDRKVNHDFQVSVGLIVYASY